MRWISLNSLFIKIFIAFWLLILLLTTALILLPKLDGRQLRPLTKSDQHSLTNQQLRIQTLINDHPKISNQKLIALDPKRALRSVYLTDLSGDLVNEHAPLKMRQFILDSQSPKKPLKRIHHSKTYLGPIKITRGPKTLLLYFSYPNQKKSLALIEWLIDNPLLLLLTALLVSTPLCAFLAWHLTHPLRQLQNVATKVAQGELDTNFPIIKNSDEITQLAGAMQQMVLSLKNMLNNQQRLLSDISHELRSPLTRLGLALAINKKHAGDSKELQRIALEAQRIELMIAEMLDLSRVQLNPDAKEDIALDLFLEELFLDAVFEANEAGKIFTYPKLTSTIIKIYPDLAYRAIENIIRNAIKYAKKTISIDIAINPQEIVLSIKNDGPLIPEAELSNIFRPFYRLNESRERETGGAGLGLSIAENAMFKHGGKIWAENIDKHVCMHLQFPRFS